MMVYLKFVDDDDDDDEKTDPPRTDEINRSSNTVDGTLLAPDDVVEHRTADITQHTTIVLTPSIAAAVDNRYYKNIAIRTALL